jgi:hypothetical protein
VDRKLKQRDRRLQRLYGINEETYQRMRAEQGGGCAICRRTQGKARLHVDHNHTTGQTRGLLCSTCNVAVGFFEKHGRQAAKYLARYDAVKMTDDELFLVDLEYEDEAA